VVAMKGSRSMAEKAWFSAAGREMREGQRRTGARELCLAETRKGITAWQFHAAGLAAGLSLLPALQIMARIVDKCVVCHVVCHVGEVLKTL